MWELGWDKNFTSGLSSICWEIKQKYESEHRRVIGYKCWNNLSTLLYMCMYVKPSFPLLNYFPSPNPTRRYQVAIKESMGLFALRYWAFNVDGLRNWFFRLDFDKLGLKCIRGHLLSDWLKPNQLTKNASTISRINCIKLSRGIMR